LYICHVKKRIYLLAYLITFSIIGLAVVQYLLVYKEKQLLENRMRLTLQQVLSKIDSRIESYEAQQLIESPDSPVRKLYQASDSVIQYPALRKKDTWCDPNKFYKENQRKLKGVQGFMTALPDQPAEDSISNEIRALQNRAIYLSYINELAKKPIRQRIPMDSLYNWISDELRQRNLDLPFEFAVYDDSIQTGVHTRNFKTGPGYFLVSYPILRAGSGQNHYRLVLSVPLNYIHTRTLHFLMLLGSAFLLILIIVYLITLYQLFKQRYLSKIKTDFINNITHEFKTPIATINLIADSIKSPAVINNPEAIKKYIQNLKNENKRMLDQVEKILTLGKIEQNKWTWKNEPVSINETIEEVIDQMSMILDKKGGVVHFSPEAVEDVIMGDPVMIHNVFVNLVDNAIKYSQNKPVIEIRTYNKKNYVVAEVKDHGVGMSKTVQKHIFDKFYRKPSGDIHNIKGHGIGLTFVKQVLDRLGADIFVESEPGKGTTFFIYFPLKNIPKNNDKTS